MNSKRMRKVCQDIAADMEADVTRFDGQPFTGRTVAEYMANQGAAIQSLAKMIDAILEERDEGTGPTP